MCFVSRQASLRSLSRKVASPHLLKAEKQSSHTFLPYFALSPSNKHKKSKQTKQTITPLLTTTSTNQHRQNGQGRYVPTHFPPRLIGRSGGGVSMFEVDDGMGWDGHARPGRSFCIRWPALDIVVLPLRCSSSASRGHDMMQVSCNARGGWCRLSCPVLRCPYAWQASHPSRPSTCSPHSRARDEILRAPS